VTETAHQEFGDDSGDDTRNDEAGPPSDFRNEHHRREWDAVPGTQKRGDTDHREERAVERIERAAHHATRQSTRYDKWNEEAADPPPATVTPVPRQRKSNMAPMIHKPREATSAQRIVS
jgi:hypothetical protein